MQWLQYLLPALVVILLLQRLLPMKGLQNLNAKEVRERLQNPSGTEFIDVREVSEYKSGHIQGFKNIPLSQLAGRYSEINSQKSIVLTCRSGMRSKQAAKILKKNGYTMLHHLKTGVSGWDGKLTK